jgi:hypothetical protein
VGLETGASTSASGNQHKRVVIKPGETAKVF